LAERSWLTKDRLLRMRHRHQVNSKWCSFAKSYWRRYLSSCACSSSWFLAVLDFWTRARSGSSYSSKTSSSCYLDCYWRSRRWLCPSESLGSSRGLRQCSHGYPQNRGCRHDVEALHLQCADFTSPKRPIFELQSCRSE